MSSRRIIHYNTDNILSERFVNDCSCIGFDERIILYYYK